MAKEDDELIHDDQGTSAEHTRGSHVCQRSYQIENNNKNCEQRASESEGKENKRRGSPGRRTKKTETVDDTHSHERAALAPPNDSARRPRSARRCATTLCFGTTKPINERHKCVFLVFSVPRIGRGEKCHSRRDRVCARAASVRGQGATEHTHPEPEPLRRAHRDKR